MLIRNTENRKNVFFESVRNKLIFCDLQDIIFGVSQDKIEKSIINLNLLPLTGIEAVHLNKNESLIDSHSAFNKESWILKYAFCKSLRSDLFLITYQEPLFYGEKVSLNTNTREVQFLREFIYEKEEFVNWWASKKGTIQTKKMYEARSRLGIFDEVLESYGLAWGGNIDGIIFDIKNSPIALIESRFSNQKTIETYDPNDYFKGTSYKSGDYMTWLPLFYLSKLLNIPLILLTFSKLSYGKCGGAVIENMDNSGITYKLNSPTKCITNSIEDCIEWLNIISM